MRWEITVLVHLCFKTQNGIDLLRRSHVKFVKYKWRNTNRNSLLYMGASERPSVMRGSVKFSLFWLTILLEKIFDVPWSLMLHWKPSKCFWCNKLTFTYDVSFSGPLHWNGCYNRAWNDYLKACVKKEAVK